MADLLISNARIYTVDTFRPSATAIAVRGDHILAVGDDLSSYVGPQTRRIDAKGATIIPGFIDSHGHMEALGDSLEILDLREAGSVAEIAALVKKAAAGLGPGERIRGRSWDQTRWPGSRFPTAEALSQAAPNSPVYLTRVDGHAAWVNR